MAQGLSSWFAIWHPRYRKSVVLLLVMAALTAALVFANNSLLEWLTRSLAVSGEAAARAGEAGPTSPRPAREVAYETLGEAAVRLGVGLPFLVLLLIIAARSLRAAVVYWHKVVGGQLIIHAKDDLESEILVHLAHKDDAFFSKHSAAETVNRLSLDLLRVGERRPDATQVVWCLLMMSANLAFFFLRDWRLGLVPLAACVAGALWTRHMTRHVKDVDAGLLRQDDEVKSRFEDYLRAAPEIQVGRYYGFVRRALGALQRVRCATFLRYIRLRAVLDSGKTVADMLAFSVMIAVIIYMRRTGSGNTAVAIVPVLIRALPYVFLDASELMSLRVDFHLARTSMNRLLEYEAHALSEVEPAPPAAAAEPIVVQTVTYRYLGPGGRRQGGVSDIATTFAPGQWVAIVGGAGSGKSTLIKLILGRLRAQTGSILYGQTPADEIDGAQFAAIFTLMPQSIALLNASIAENLLFGTPAAAGDDDAASRFADADLDVLDGIGLGAVCRLKALEMSPAAPADAAALGGDIPALRRRVREHLHKACGVAVLPYEQGHSDRAHWVLECLVGGRCDHESSLGALMGVKGHAPLQALAGSSLGGQLVEVGRRILSETGHLLGMPNYHAYAQLTAFPLPERVWRLRSASVDVAAKGTLTREDTAALCAIGLTSSPAELGHDESAEQWLQPAVRDQFAAEVAALNGLLGDVCQPYAIDEIHPNLSWRENLVFGVVDIRNSRTARLVDQALLDFVGQEGLRGTFTRFGLRFGIGRLGANLSGGQGQLVALSRAVLRRTPVLVLDEPTSALDPASRSRVAQFLREWRAGRVVVTISHDPEFVRHADDIRLLEGGRLVASGTFQELEEGSEAFRRTLRQT